MGKRGRKGGLRVGCLALGNLTRSTGASISVILDAGGVDVIVETMQKHAAAIPVIEACILALTSISQVDKGLTAIRGAGGVAVVHEAQQAGVKVAPALLRSFDST